MTDSHQVEKTSFLRLDNASVMELITSTAGVLSSHDTVSSKFSDELRIVLSGIQASGDDRTKPVLLELIKQNSQYLQILITRYGSVGFCINILRHSLRLTLKDTLAALGEWGNGLLAKSELYFNRPFYLYVDGKCQRKVLFSKILVDKAAALAGMCNEIESIMESLSSMWPSDMQVLSEEDKKIDFEVAQAIGFNDLEKTVLPTYIESHAQQAISQTFQTIADLTSGFSKQLAANISKNKSINFDVVCDAFRAEAIRFSGLVMPVTVDVVTLEIRRQNLLHNLANLNHLIRQLAAESVNSIAEIKTNADQKVTLIPKSMNRQIAFDMMTAGTAPLHAIEATEDLIAYLLKNNIKPKQMLTGELSRINQHLMPRSLELLQSLAVDEDLIQTGAEEKKLTLDSMTKLRKIFQHFINSSTSLLLIGIYAGSMFGCGLKTTPESNIIEFRPDIPFHPKAAAFGPATIDGEEKDQDKTILRTPHEVLDEATKNQ